MRGSWDGILLVDKEEGLTSAGVVARCRRLLGMKRVGHTGTLDPFATGLLPVVFGRATGAAGYIQDRDKVYRAKIQLGSATDTMDLEGELTDRVEGPEVCRDYLPGGEGYGRICEVLASLTGETLQEAPAYSAVKVGGKALYSYAREGKEVTRPLRSIRVDEARLLSIQEGPGGWPVLEIDFKVSSGTYIRALADLLGRRLSCFGHAVSLRRLSVGDFDLERALTLTQLFSLYDDLDKDRQAFREALEAGGAVLDTGRAFADWPRLDLDPQRALELSYGRPLALEEDLDRAAFFYRDRLLALGRVEGGLSRVSRVFMTPDMVREGGRS